jgi:Predicted membrane protein (DUF2142)
MSRRSASRTPANNRAKQPKATGSPGKGSNSNRATPATPSAKSAPEQTATATPSAKSKPKQTATATPPAKSKPKQTATATPPAKSKPKQTAAATPPAKSKPKQTAAATPPAKSKPKHTATTGAPARGRRALSRSPLDARRRAERKRELERQRGLSLRAALRSVPRAAWICALLAFLNAACWSVISPPFQIPDEPSHFAYVQHLAETGTLPTEPGEKFPNAEEAVLNDLDYAGVREHPSVGTISSEAQQRVLEQALTHHYSRTDSAAAGVATSQPPLYYALETIPYTLASGGTVLDRLALMRLLSALLGGLTALFAYLFLREALPGARWAWTVGGLGVALAPLLGVMSGAVNPDALLFTVSTALFYCLARGFRRGISPRLAVAIGATLAIGFMTKLNFVGLLPGAVLGLLVLCLREARTSRQSAYRCLGLALGVGGSPILLYILISAASGGSAPSVILEGITHHRAHGSILEELSYIWQFYLPRLPGMRSYFHGFPTTRVFWFNGLVGLYGWLDTTFPVWVYSAALIPAGLIAALFARALLISRSALRERVSELLTYLAMSLGVLFIIGADDYLHSNPGEYAEPRYVLPMIALWGAALALAARGAGRRWGPVVGVAIVTLMVAHDLFSQLLVISRYYG